MNDSTTDVTDALVCACMHDREYFKTFYMQCGPSMKTL